MRREFNDSQSREVVKKKRCEGKETGLNRVLSTATRLTGRIPRYAHVSEYMRDVLHCFSFPQRITYRGFCTNLGLHWGIDNPIPISAGTLLLHFGCSMGEGLSGHLFKRIFLYPNVDLLSAYGIKSNICNTQADMKIYNYLLIIWQ